MSEAAPQIPEPADASAVRAPRLASLGLRFVGRLIDNVVLIAVFILSSVVLTDPGAASATAKTSLYLVVLGFSFANDVALTALTGGSLGKLVSGTRVARWDDWQPIRMGAALLRWIVIVVLTVIPFGPIADGGWIFSSQFRQTLHDRAARTIVVRAEGR